MPGRRRRTAVVGIAALAMTMVWPVSSAMAVPGEACDKRPSNTYEKLLACMTVEGVREHLAAFQKIADNSNDPVYPGTRAAGTQG